MRVWVQRIVIIMMLLLFCLYSTQKPIFTEFEETIRENEGREYSLYFAEIIGELSPNSYLIGTGFERNYLVVETQGGFENGEIVSFRGRINNGRLVANGHHLHGQPNMPYYLSIAGLGLFSIIFFREWRVSIRDLSLGRR